MTTNAIDQVLEVVRPLVAEAGASRPKVAGSWWACRIYTDPVRADAVLHGPDGTEVIYRARNVEALAEVARLARSKAFCRALISAKTPEEVVGLMKGE